MSRNRLYNRTYGTSKASNMRQASRCDTDRLSLPQPRCNTCVADSVSQLESSSCPAEGRRRHLFKQMFNTVRVTSSEYAMNKSALHVGNDTTTRTAIGNNQSSDRAVASVVANVNAPSRGNSRTSSITRIRPGSLTPGGTGVDIKHNSYARYLARIKGTELLKEETSCQTISDTALRNNNKARKYNIVALPSSCSCP